MFYRISSAISLLLTAALVPGVEFVYPTGFTAATATGSPAQVGEIGCVDVRAYGATGDGTTDDTAALNAALNGTRSQGGRPPDHYSARPRVVYLPPGTYKVSGTLTWVGINLTVRGAGRGDTVIRLVNGAAGFGSAGSPKAVLQTWRTSNYGFSQNIRDLTVDTGSGNAGAVGIEYNANNVGALQNVLVTGSGQRGVDLTQNWPGPCLLKNVEVRGFAVGIDVGGPEYGPTFDGITLSGQTVAGLRSTDNPLSVRRLTSVNSVPAVLTTGSRSLLLLLGADCTGGASGVSAITLAAGGSAYLRGIHSAGYRGALKEGTTDVPGADLTERVTGPVRHLFGSDAEAAAKLSLKLPIQETPTFHDNNPAHWGRLLRSYERNTSDPNANSDVTAGMTAFNQAVFDNTALTTVWMPTGTAIAGVADGTPLTAAGFRVPPHIRRFTGFATNINKWNDAREFSLVLRVQDDAATPLIIDDVRGDLFVYHTSARAVVLRNGQFGYRAGPGAGPLFLEDVGTGNITTVPSQRVWARQLNIEGTQLHLDNDGGDLWVFGLKTENGGLVARTRNGGRTEFLGTLLYALHPAGTAFESVDGHCSLAYATSNYTGDYATQVAETRAGDARTLPTGSAGARFSMPMYVGWSGDRAAVSALAAPVGNTVSLGARADGSGGAVTWSSSPAGATFSGSGASTTATFPGPGRYTVTASYADGSSGVLAITVGGAASGGGEINSGGGSSGGNGSTSGGGGGGGCSTGALGMLLCGFPALLLARRRRRG